MTLIGNRLRHAVAAGEPLNPGVVHTWGEAAGALVRDGYGQTETGHLTGMPIGLPVRPGSMGRPLPGFRAWIDSGELVVDPATVAAPDDVRGQVVRAVVVLSPGREPSDALAKEIQEHVKASTAPYKYPRLVDFTSELPKTPSGKIRRSLLRGEGI